MSSLALIDRLRPVVDDTIASLAKTKFRVDPVGGAQYSKATSIVSAAYKRHGRILELPIELPYLSGGRTVQVDAIVYDRRVGTVRAYEIKRANGDFDAGKKRSILKDLLAVQALLKSYTSKRGISANLGEARLVAYYGVKPLPSPLCIAGDEMDDHFVFAVHKHVEEVNGHALRRPRYHAGPSLLHRSSTCISLERPAPKRPDYAPMGPRINAPPIPAAAATDHNVRRSRKANECAST